MNTICINAPFFFSLKTSIESYLAFRGTGGASLVKEKPWKPIAGLEPAAPAWAYCV